jgi:hypothetical protein
MGRWSGWRSDWSISNRTGVVATVGGVSRNSLPLTFRVDGHSVGGETLFVEAGAAVLVFTSCCAGLGIELRSAYLDGGRGGEVLVAESAVLAGDAAELKSRRLEDVEEVLTYQRRRLLYDHLQALQDLAALAGLSLAFDRIEAAAAVLDPRSPLVSSS